MQKSQGADEDLWNVILFLAKNHEKGITPFRVTNEGLNAEFRSIQFFMDIGSE